MILERVDQNFSAGLHVQLRNLENYVPKIRNILAEYFRTKNLVSLKFIAEFTTQITNQVKRLSRIFGTFSTQKMSRPLSPDPVVKVRPIRGDQLSLCQHERSIFCSRSTFNSTAL